MVWNAIKRQLRSVIEWESPDHSALFELWSDNGDEIKDASQLVLEPGQGAVFVYGGKIKAVLTEPGTYDIETANVPFLTTLSKAMQAFESEHKVGFYFFWQTEFLNQKWGTTGPVKYTDPVYEFPVALRAFGNFSFRLTEPESFFVNLVGGRDRFAVDDVRTTLAQRLQQPLTDMLATSGFSYADIDRNRDELAQAASERLAKEFELIGLSLTDFRIEATNFDDDTNRRIARIADVSAEAIAAGKAGLDYRSLQQTEALREAARNEGGAAGVGAGLGAGMAMAQQMVGGAAAPATNSNDNSVEARLMKLKSLLDKGLISEADYDAKKQQILSEL